MQIGRLFDCHVSKSVTGRYFFSSRNDFDGLNYQLVGSIGGWWLP